MDWDAKPSSKTARQKLPTQNCNPESQRDPSLFIYIYSSLIIIIIYTQNTQHPISPHVNNPTCSPPKKYTL